jgi:hypothetical protein
MKTKQHKPRWWILYTLLIGVIGILVFESRDGLPAWANEFVGIGVVLGFFGVVAIWMIANQSTLADEEYTEYDDEELIVQEFPPQVTVEQRKSTVLGGYFASDPAQGYANVSKN